MSYHFHKLSALIAEDTPPMQNLIGALLGTLGVGRIIKAADGAQGFELFCDENPDIVLTDWQMSPATGLEMVDQIRKSSLSPNKTVPIILLTGYSAPARITRARDLGVTEFLIKPFSAGDLIRRIAHVISHPRDFIETPDFFGPDRRRTQSAPFAGPCKRRSPATA
ncbi:MAG: response regulator [Alphaproteobacteria bacterium]|nr:response regulator [Alphaproteobacteria bacterium]